MGIEELNKRIETSINSHTEHDLKDDGMCECSQCIANEFFVKGILEAKKEILEEIEKMITEAENGKCSDKWCKECIARLDSLILLKLKLEV